MAIYGSEGSQDAHKQYSPQDIQYLQLWKDKTGEATMMLESNAKVLKVLQGYYIGLLDNQDFPLRTECQKSIHSFAARIEKNMDWMQIQADRARLLAGIISDRRELVSAKSAEVFQAYIFLLVRCYNTLKIKPCHVRNDLMRTWKGRQS
jgi:hypothetical protein